MKSYLSIDNMNSEDLIKFYSRIKYSIVFIALMLIDIGPIPVTALLGLYVIIFRPRWFKNIIDKLY